VATSDPLNYDALEALERSIATKPIKVYIALKEDIEDFFARLEIVNITLSIAQELKREMIHRGSGNRKRKRED
jgi:general secretion pathway protein E/type IV pilus assembly protein PilB